MVNRNLPILGGKENRKKSGEENRERNGDFWKPGAKRRLTGIENGIKSGLKRDLLELEMVKRFFQVLERKEVQEGEPVAKRDGDNRRLNRLRNGIDRDWKWD